ncbi:MAG: saccharopine dehydrogenase NADP-binding domain-containing protein [Bacillota bacterium]
MSRLKTLILGGYGSFGRLIARALCAGGDIQVIVAGRDGAKARALAGELGCGFAAIGADDPELRDRLAAIGAQLVVSTAGPFQGQDYRVARAAIAAGSHYVDIADGREFVCGITQLDAEARANDVLVVSGASSVPALSCAVVDRYSADFASLAEIEVGICTSARIPGDATVRAILGYCGRPIPRWRHGVRGKAVGWQGLRRHRFRDGLTRWLCDADFPDLELDPCRYPGVQSVRCGAGLEPAFVHWGLWGLSAMVRARILPGLAGSARLLAGFARRMQPLGSARSAMFVRLRGEGPDGRMLQKTWELVAERHEGANIPCMAAVNLARRLARGTLAERGAHACVGMIDLDEYLAELRAFSVRWNVFPA